MTIAEQVAHDFLENIEKMITANKLDVGFICMPPSKAELKKIESITHKIVGCPVPNMCTWIYKIRRGRITRVIIWSLYDLGIMRVKDLFVTNINFELIAADP